MTNMFSSSTNPINNGSGDTFNPGATYTITVNLATGATGFGAEFLSSSPHTLTFSFSP